MGIVAVGTSSSPNGTAFAIGTADVASPLSPSLRQKWLRSWERRKLRESREVPRDAASAEASPAKVSSPGARFAAWASGDRRHAARERRDAAKSAAAAAVARRKAQAVRIETLITGAQDAAAGQRHPFSGSGTRR